MTDWTFDGLNIDGTIVTRLPSRRRFCPKMTTEKFFLTIMIDEYLFYFSVTVQCGRLS